MRHTPLTVALALLLAACATEVRDETPGQARTPAPAIRTQSYTPGIGAAPAPSRAEAEPARQQAQNSQNPNREPDRQAPRRRVGSSSPAPEQAVPFITTPGLPPPPSNRDAVNDAKRDLMQPQLDRLREADRFNQLDPVGQRDLLLRQHEQNTIGR